MDDGKKWRRRKDARPAELTAAALALFVERGFKATRLEDVAARAGVTKGTLYLYFKDKEALFAAVVREGVLPNMIQAEQFIRAHQGSTADLIRQLVRFWWHHVGSTPIGGLPKLMFAEATNFPDLCRLFLDEIFNRGQTLLASVVRRGIASGEFRDCDPRYIARLIVAPMVFQAVWNRSLAPLEGEPLDDERYIENHLELLLGGLVAK